MKPLAILVFMICLYGCEQNNSQTIVTYYPNGPIKSMVNISNGKQDGISRYFNKAGRLIKLRYYDNGRLDSVIGYFEDGKRRYIGRADFKTHTCIMKWYYRNGNISKMNTYASDSITADDSLLGGQYYFYENGHISLYRLDYMSNPQYERRFDSVTGAVKSQQGDWNPLLIPSSLKDTIPVDSNYYIRVFLNNAPGLKTTMVYKVGSNKDSTVWIPIKKDPFIIYPPRKKSYYGIRTKGEVLDSVAGRKMVFDGIFHWYRN